MRLPILGWSDLKVGVLGLVLLPIWLPVLLAAMLLDIVFDLLERLGANLKDLYRDLL